MRLSVCIAAVALAVSALPVAAQTTPPPNPNTPPPPPSARILQDRPYTAVMPGMQASYETFLDSASGNNIGPQPLARIDLANRVSTLMELGRCTEAREHARAAGDRQMALRARQLCRTDRAG